MFPVKALHTGAGDSLFDSSSALLSVLDLLFVNSFTTLTS